MNSLLKMNGGNEPEMNRRNELEMNRRNELEMNQQKGVEMNRRNEPNNRSGNEPELLVRICKELNGFATITDKQNNCFLPQHKPNSLVAFDIVDKLRDFEAEIACTVLDELITYFPEVQDYLVNNHIDILVEE